MHNTLTDVVNQNSDKGVINCRTTNKFMDLLKCRLCCFYRVSMSYHKKEKETVLIVLPFFHP